MDSGHDADDAVGGGEVEMGGDSSTARTAPGIHRGAKAVGNEVGATNEVSADECAERLTQLNGIIELMRPAVQADGGDIALIRADVATGVVEVQLQGACSSCAVSSSTLQGGVERILHDRLPWVTEVLGSVDESGDPFESAAMGRGGYVSSF